MTSHALLMYRANKVFVVKTTQKNQTASLVRICRSGQGLNRVKASHIKYGTNDVTCTTYV